MASLRRLLASGLSGAWLGAALVALPPTTGAVREFSWLDLTAAVEWTALPFLVVGACLLAAVLRSAPRGLVAVVGLTWGLSVVLLPEVAWRLVPAEWAPLLAAGLVLVAFLDGAVLGGVLAGRVPHDSLTRFERSSRALVLPALVFLAAPWMPGRPAAIGDLTAPDVAAAPSAPDLVLVVLDAVRADHLGSYGYERPTSPNLDALAEEGLRFARAESVATHAGPSLASLFTGVPPSGHGVIGPLAGLPAGRETLAVRLGAAGYRRAGLVADFSLRRDRGFHQGFQLYDDSLVLPGSFGRAVLAAADETGLGATLGRVGLPRLGSVAAWMADLTRPSEPVAAEVVDRAEALLARLEASDGPFFLFLDFTDARAPYLPPGEWRDRFLEHDPGRFAGELSPTAFLRRLEALQRELDEGRASREELEASKDLYDGELAYLDDQLGRLFRLLDQVVARRDRPFLLAVVADHGEGFGEHGLLTHGEDLWEECLHVPLLIRGDGVEPDVVEVPVTTLDLTSTFLSAAGLPPMGDSMDLLAGTERPAGHVIAEEGRAHSPTRFGRIERVAVYFGSLKLVLQVDEDAQRLRPERLFDLAADPGETITLAAPRALELLEELEAFRRRWWDRYLEGRRHASAIPRSPSERAALASLGCADG